MNARSLQARWQLGELLPEDVPGLAAALLVEGVDTPALRVVAGLQSPSRSDLQPWLERYFDEAGLPRITDDDARWRVAYDTARDIVAGSIAPRDGARLMWELCTDLGWPESLRYFVYLAADYGEGPKDPVTEAAWFDAAIVRTAGELLATEPDSPSADGG